MRIQKAILMNLAAVVLWIGTQTAWALSEEEQIAARLSAEASTFLEQMLGPGRTKVLVRVEGESSQTHTESEVLTPIPSETQADVPMPGYADKVRAPGLDYVQKDSERSSRRRSFQIRTIAAVVVLDQGVSKDQENAIRRVIPDLLSMNGERGDNLSVLRAKLLPPWKSAWFSPEGIREGMRLGILFIGVALLLLVLAVIFSWTALRAVRTFTAELAVRRPPDELAAEAAHGLEGMHDAELAAPGDIPRLGGGVPGLAAPSASGGAPALGQRFDFISSRPPKEVARLLAEEPPEDIALLFAHIVATHPEQASRIFEVMPKNIRDDVSQRMVRLESADPERLAMLENRLRSSVEYSVRGTDRLSGLLSRLPPGEREDVMGQLMSQDPEAARDVERSLFTFEGIGALRPEGLRRLIVSVPLPDWGVALRGAPEDLINRVMAELPEGSREMVRDAFESVQPRGRVLESRSRVLSQAQALAADGRITLSDDAARDMI